MRDGEDLRRRTSFRSYRDLEVWQLAIQTTVECYRFTSSFPDTEKFGLTSQIRRAASSIAANIAEGHGREGTGDFVRFLQIAQGSLKELETHLIIAKEVGVADPDGIGNLLARTDRQGRMLRSLIRSLQSRRS